MNDVYWLSKHKSYLVMLAVFIAAFFGYWYMFNRIDAADARALAAEGKVLEYEQNAGNQAAVNSFIQAHPKDETLLSVSSQNITYIALSQNGDVVTLHALFGNDWIPLIQQRLPANDTSP